jgi:cytochrome c oxidase subunit 2
MFNGASNYANSVDTAMLIIIGISVVLLVGITVAMIYFVFKYSRKNNPVATQIHGNIFLEITWIVIPTILVMVMFWYGYEGFQKLRARTDIGMEVKVNAFMWGWNFVYANGKSTDTLYLPVNVTTKMRMKSRDVNHSFYIPAFRIKEDVIGGRQSFMVLEPKQIGDYDITCAEYCGLKHSQMYTKLHVVSQADFDLWLAKGLEQKNPVTPAVDSTKVETKVVK